jgi:hypothetical protein
MDLALNFGHPMTLPPPRAKPILRNKKLEIFWPLGVVDPPSRAMEPPLLNYFYYFDFEFKTKIFEIIIKKKSIWAMCPLPPRILMGKM